MRVEIVTATEWQHDNCGGKVDTSGIYWKCQKCGSFVYVAVCNGNSTAVPPGYPNCWDGWKLSIVDGVIVLTEQEAA